MAGVGVVSDEDAGGVVVVAGVGGADSAAAGAGEIGGAVLPLLAVGLLASAAGAGDEFLDDGAGVGVIAVGAGSAVAGTALFVEGLVTVAGTGAEVGAAVELSDDNDVELFAGGVVTIVGLGATTAGSGLLIFGWAIFFLGLVKALL